MKERPLVHSDQPRNQKIRSYISSITEKTFPLCSANKIKKTKKRDNIHSYEIRSIRVDGFNAIPLGYAH